MSVDTADTDPLLDVFTDNEERLAEMIRGDGEKASTLGMVGAAIAAAFLLYRAYMWRRMREETRTYTPPDAHSLFELNSKIFVSGWARFAFTLAPALVSGYQMGLREIQLGAVPQTWLDDTADDYAIRLIESLQETSGEALVEGFQAQLNRRIVARRALENTIDAFGVAPRTMKSLVNLWASEPVKMLTDQPVRNNVKDRADNIVAMAIDKRAKDIGSTESYVAKNSAKSIVWLYLQQKGDLPADATKMWVTAKDERVCPTCGPLHHVQVPLSEKFLTEQGEVWAPALHPRCRCNIVLRGAVRVFNFDDELVEEEPRELEVAKNAWGVVSKARPGDPWDRARNGRFATTEQRSATDERVERLLATVQPVEEQVELPGKVDFAPKVNFRPKVELAPKAEIVRPTEKVDFAPSQQTEEKVEIATAPVDFDQKKVDLELKKVSFELAKAQLDNIKVNFTKPTVELSRTIPPPEVDDYDDNIPGWTDTPTRQPMYGVLGSIDEWQSGNLAEVDESIPWYTAGERGYGIRTLDQAVHDYWKEQGSQENTVREWEDFYLQNDGVNGIVPVKSGNHVFLVEYEHFQLAWAAAIHQMPLALAEPMYLDAIEPMQSYDPDADPDDYVDDDIDYAAPERTSAAELAAVMGLYAKADELTPVILVSDKLSENADGVWGGIMNQSGQFSLTDNETFDNLYNKRMNAPSNGRDLSALGDLRYIAVHGEPLPD